MSFREQLKTARRAKGYTQKQIAEILGITESTYCGYETGKREPDVLKLKRIAAILGTSCDTLLEIEDDVPTFDPLTDEEAYIIEQYRSMNGQGQEYIRQTMHMAVQIYKNTDNSADMAANK